jgi:hypothetical protein
VKGGYGAVRSFFKFLAFSLVVLVGAVIAGLIARNHLVPQKDLMAIRREELKSAVRLAGTPLVETPPLQTLDYGAEASRLVAIYQKRDMEFDNPELTKAWAQIETDVDGGLLILKQISIIDREKPSGVEIVSDALQNDDKEKQDAFWSSIGVRVVSEAGKIQLEDKFREAEAHLDASIASLQDVAQGLSPQPLPNTISVRYLPSWQGRLVGDLVEIQNASGDTLEDATIFVTAHDSNGNSKVHLHYADQWPSGATLRALYPYRSTDYANSQSLENPASVDVAVYSPAGHAQASYALTQDEWDSLIKEYCARLVFTGQDLSPYVEDVTNQRYASGYELQFQGLPTLPVKSIQLRFLSNSGETRTADFTIPSGVIEAGKPLPLRSELLDGDPPDHVEYTLNFNGTTYQQTVQAH